MIHYMKINDSAFKRMNNGTKVREYRMNDEKRRKVQIGDIIEFHKISNPEDIDRKSTRLNSSHSV